MLIVIKNAARKNPCVTKGITGSSLDEQDLGPTI
jgi:hypothetical protein